MADADRAAVAKRNSRTVSEREVPESNLVQFFDASVALRPTKRIRHVESVWKDLREVLQRVPGITPERIEDVCASLNQPDFTDTSEEHDPESSPRALDFGVIPLHVILNIASFCDAQSLCAFRETCRAARGALDSPSAVVVWEKATTKLNRELELASSRSAFLGPKVRGHLTSEFSILLPRDITQMIRKVMREIVYSDHEITKRKAIVKVFEKISHCVNVVCGRAQSLSDDGRLQNDVNSVFDSAREIAHMALTFVSSKISFSREQAYYAMGRLLRVIDVLLQKVFMRRNILADPSRRMNFSMNIVKAMFDLPRLTDAVRGLNCYVQRLRSESEVCNYEFPFECQVTDKPAPLVDERDCIFESGITVAIVVKNGWCPLETFLDYIPNDETLCYRTMGGGVMWRTDLGCIRDEASDAIKVMTKEPRSVRGYRAHVLRQAFLQEEGSYGSRDARSSIAYRKYVECFGNGAEEYFARRDFGEKHRLTLPQCFALALAQASDTFEVRSRRVFSTVRIAGDFCSLASDSSLPLIGPEERVYDANTSAQKLLLTVLDASHTRVKLDASGATLNSHIVTTLLDRLHHARLCGSGFIAYPTYVGEECVFMHTPPSGLSSILDFSAGDRLCTPRGCCTVIGYRDHSLWVQYDDGFAATNSGITKPRSAELKFGVGRVYNGTKACKATVSPNAYHDIARALSHYANYAGMKKKTGDRCEEDHEEKSSPSQHMSDFDMAALSEVDNLGAIACDVDDCYFTCPIFLRLSHKTIRDGVPENLTGFVPDLLVNDERPLEVRASLTPNEWFVEWASIPDPEKRRRSWLPAMIWIAANTAVLERRIEYMAIRLNEAGALLNMRLAFAYIVIDALPLIKSYVPTGDRWENFTYVVNVRVALWKLIAYCDAVSSAKECEAFSRYCNFNFVGDSTRSTLHQMDGHTALYCSACVGVELMNTTIHGLVMYNIELVGNALGNISWDPSGGTLSRILENPKIVRESGQYSQTLMSIDPDTGLAFDTLAGVNFSEESYVRKEVGYNGRNIYALGNLFIEALFPPRGRYLGGRDGGNPEYAIQILSKTLHGLSRMTNTRLYLHNHDNDILLFIDKVINKAIEVGGTPCGFRDLLTNDERHEWTHLVRELYRLMDFIHSDTTVGGVARSSYTFKWTDLYDMIYPNSFLGDALERDIIGFLESDTETHMEFSKHSPRVTPGSIFKMLGMDVSPLEGCWNIRSVVSSAAPLQARVVFIGADSHVVIDKLTNAPYEAYVTKFTESYENFRQFASVFIPEL